MAKTPKKVNPRAVNESTGGKVGVNNQGVGNVVSNTLNSVGEGISQTVQSIPGAVEGAVTGAIETAGNEVANFAGGLLGDFFGSLGLGNVMGGTSSTQVLIGFKAGHPYSSYPGMLGPLNKTGGLLWPYRPSIDVSRSIEYESIAPVHSLIEFQSFKNNRAAEISVSGQFTSQTIEEGQYTNAAINFLETASYMAFGSSGQVPKGMPPPVLNFSAYGVGNMPSLSVIIRSYVQNWPNDVDYIDIGGTTVPTLCTITTQLIVVKSPRSTRDFSLDSFASGNKQGIV